MADDVVIYGDVYWDFDFGRHHPVRPYRVKLAFDLMRDMNLLEGAVVLPPKEACMEELLVYHTED